MTGFLRPWVGELIADSSREWEGPASAWEAQGIGFLQVLRYNLLSPEHASRQPKGLYEEVQKTLQLEPGFIVIRVGDSLNAFTAVVPKHALVTLQEETRGKRVKPMGLTGMIMRMDFTVKMDASGDLPPSTGVLPSAPCYLLVKRLSMFSRKSGVIGTCRPAALPPRLQALRNSSASEESQGQPQPQQQQQQQQQPTASEAEKDHRHHQQAEQPQDQMTQAAEPQDADAGPSGGKDEEQKQQEAAGGKDRSAGVECRTMEVWECVVPTEQLQLQPFRDTEPSTASAPMEEELGFELEDIEPAPASFEPSPSASSGPAYPPLSLASSSTPSQEADASVPAAVVVQQSRDSLELNTSKELDTDSVMDFNSLNESDLSQQELEAVRKNRLLDVKSQGVDSQGVEDSPPLLLQLSPIKEGGDSPIFQRPARSASSSPTLPDSSRDVSMELVSDLYADLATQDSTTLDEGQSQPVGSETSNEAQIMEGITADVGEEDSMCDDTDLSALMAVSRDTQAATPSQGDLLTSGRLSLDDEEHGDGTDASLVDMAQEVREGEASILEEEKEARRKAQERLAQEEERHRELESAQRLLMEDAEEKNDQLERENAKLRSDVSHLKLELAARERELNKTQLLVHELHKKLKQQAEASKPDRMEAQEDTSSLRVNRQLPTALLERKKRQKEMATSGVIVASRGDSRGATAKASAIAGRAQRMAVKGNSTLKGSGSSVSPTSSTSRVSSSPSKGQRVAEPSSSKSTSAPPHKPRPAQSPSRAKLASPHRVATAARSSPANASPLAGRKRLSPTSATAQRPAPPKVRRKENPTSPAASAAATSSSNAKKPAPKRPASSHKSRKMALFSQKYLVKK